MNSISFAIKSLKSHKLRTALTVLAVSIGIAAVIIVMSAGEGLRSLVMSQIETFGADLIQIEIKVPGTAKNSSENAMGMAAGVAITTLKDSDREAILKEIPQALAGYSGVIDQQQISCGDKNKKVMIFGTSASVLDVDSGEISRGRMYSESENDSMASVAVLGSEIAEKFFSGDDPIGKTIRIKQKQFRVIGVFKERGSMAFFNFDELIYIPLKTLQKQITGIDHVSFISIKSDKNYDQKKIVSQIEKILRERHDISEPIKDDFAVTSMEEAKEMVGTILGALELLLLALAAISLAVGGVGIMNIMYVSVKERTFEIGLRKSLGAKYRDILFQFLAESIAVSLLGSLAGIIIGSGISFAAAKLALSRGFAWKFSIPLISIILAIGFSAGTGILFGYWPAKSAAKKDAIDALSEK